MDSETRAEIEVIKAELAHQAELIAELKLSRTQKKVRTFRRYQRAIAGAIACLIFVPLALRAFTTPNTFIAGTPTVAADVNANFTAIANSLSAMENKSWRLIYEMDIVAPISSFSAAGLNGDTDFEYMIIAKIINGSSAANYYLRPNGDSSASNYGAQQITGVGTTASAQASTTYGGLYLCFAEPGTFCETRSTILAKSGSPRTNMGVYSGNISGATIGAHSSFSTVWSQTANITSLSFNSDQTNGFGAGSHIEIWARR